MRQTWTVLLMRHQQPDEQVWARIRRLVGGWDHPRFGAVTGEMSQGAFSSRSQLDRFLAALGRIEGAAHLLVERAEVDDEDYAAADLVAVWGADLPVDAPLVANRATAYRQPPPCPGCGRGDEFDLVAVEALRIDLDVLRGPQADGSAPGAGGWDVADLPNGQLLVSGRVRELLRTGRVRGYELTGVLDATTGEPLPGHAALSARRAVLRPCPAGPGEPEPPAVCPGCGTTLTSSGGLVRLRGSDVGDDEVISRHPGRHALLHVNQRVHRLLWGAGLAGLRRTGIATLC